jgi:hypothetical protein
VGLSICAQARFLGVSDQNFFKTGTDLEIRISADPQNHTITIEWGNFPPTQNHTITIEWRGLPQNRATPPSP